MTLRYSSSDSYASSRDNHWQTATHLIDSIKNTNNILSPDDSSLRLTTAPSQTAVQNIVRQILHNFLSRLNLVHGLHITHQSMREEQTQTPSITRAQKLNHKLFFLFNKYNITP